MSASKSHKYIIAVFIGAISFVSSKSAFAAHEDFIFRELITEGNQRTRPQVFLREIGYEIGDTVPYADSMAQVWQGRISGLNLFNFVEVQAKNDTVIIRVAERYYTWARPMLQWADRNFNVWWQTRDPERLIYGGTLFLNNLAGLNHSAFITAIAGYNRVLDAGYSVPFRSHRNSWGFAVRAYYWTNHELWYQTRGNVLQFMHKSDGSIQENAGAGTVLRRRMSYFSRLELGLGWGYTRIDSAAAAASPDYLYKGLSQQEYFTKVEYILDHRNQRDYPTSGYLLRTGVAYTQFNTLRSGDFMAEGWFRGSVFIPLNPKRNAVLASAISGGLNNPATYRLSRQLGYGSDYVRGYEPYVADGNGFILGKLAFRKALVNKKAVVVKGPAWLKNYTRIPLSLWFNIFADAGRVIQPREVAENPLSASWFRGTGIGVDVIAWYSAMMRAEYSFNHLGEGVFNLTFNNAF